MSKFNKKQLEELAASAIASDIAELNIEPLIGDRAVEALLHSLPREERRNDGRVRDKLLNRYKHIYKDGGAAFYEIDLETGDRGNCATFKPVSPVFPDRKYENPPGAETQALYPGVTYRVWKLTSNIFGVSIPDQVLADNPNDSDHAKGYWKWVFENEDIPIIIAEGAKKAYSAVSAGFPCIAVIGIWNGVKAIRDENGKTKEYDLIPSLQYLTGQKIYIAFDRDQKAATIKNVIQARSVLASKLIEIGCDCYSMRWDSDEGKGLDDLIVSGGVEALEKSIADAEELTGETPNFKKPMAASILAEKIAKEWRGRVHYHLPTKLWRVYKKGIWESLENDAMEAIIYNRIVEDAPCLNSHNYVVTILKFVRASLIVEK